MAAPDIGSCLSAGIDGFKKNPVAHILAVVLIGAVGGVSAGVLSGPMVVGYMRLIQKEERGEAVEFTDVFKGFDDFVPALLAVLLSSLIVSVANQPGAVHDLLVPLKTHGVSMTRFESRPARSGQWEYYFYIDLQGHPSQPNVAAALKDLKSLCAFYKVLGTYPAGE